MHSILSHNFFLGSYAGLIPTRKIICLGRIKMYYFIVQKGLAFYLSIGTYIKYFFYIELYRITNLRLKFQRYKFTHWCTGTALLACWPFINKIWPFCRIIRSQLRGAWIVEWYHTWLLSMVHCAMPWALNSSLGDDQTLFWTQAQHLCFIHDSIWFIWFDTIICLSIVMWIVKQKIENKISQNICFKKSPLSS